ncbi:MAG: amidohydrolase family protein [Acidimicrobiia bacterium]|nr:amidohydrolase family protein [Acidimicrobiia bacterium]
MTGESILIESASLRGRPGLHDITVDAGAITAIEDAGSTRQSADVVIDAGSGLVTESFCNAHLHLDKVFTLARLGDHALDFYQGEGMGQAMSAIDAAAEVKRSQDADQMLALVRRATAMAAFYGTTHIRAFADVDSKAGTRGVEVLCAVRDEFSGIVDLQVVAFPQDGIIKEPGTVELLHKSIDIGADVVGGIPWIEFTENAMQEHVRIAFDLAAEYGKDVSMLLDDAGDPGLRTLEMMAVEAISRGWHGRALAHHCRAMELYPMPYLERLVALLREARVSIVSDPHTGPLHARVAELLAAGVNVVLGQDDISDAYYAFGRNNMLEVAFLGAHLLWMMTRDGQETVYDMVTTRAAESMGVADHTLAVGNPAHLVILPVPDVTEALRFQPTPLAVVSHGALVDRGGMAAIGGIPGH